MNLKITFFVVVMTTALLVSACGGGGPLTPVPVQPTATLSPEQIAAAAAEALRIKCEGLMESNPREVYYSYPPDLWIPPTGVGTPGFPPSEGELRSATLRVLITPVVSECGNDIQVWVAFWNMGSGFYEGVNPDEFLKNSQLIVVLSDQTEYEIPLSPNNGIAITQINNFGKIGDIADLKFFIRPGTLEIPELTQKESMDMGGMGVGWHLHLAEKGFWEWMASNTPTPVPCRYDWQENNGLPLCPTATPWGGELLEFLNTPTPPPAP